MALPQLAGKKTHGSQKAQEMRSKRAELGKAEEGNHHAARFWSRLTMK